MTLSTFLKPKVSAHAQALAGLPSAADVRCRILVAEDDPEMRSLLVEAIRRQGHEVTAVENGMEVCRRLEYLPPDSPREAVGYDLILSDIRMPGLSGLQVAALARSRWPGIPIILITAFGDDEVYDAAAELEVADVLDKPIDLDELMSRIRVVLSLWTDPDEGTPAEA